MGTAEWKQDAIRIGIGIVVAIAAAFLLGPQVPEGTSALLSAFAAIVALGLIILVPYRQLRDQLEQKRTDATERADAIVKLLKSDILSVTLQCTVALRLIKRVDIRSPVMASRVSFMQGMQIRMSGQFDLLTAEVVRADIERLTPLIDLVSAVDYHNNLMAQHGDHPEMIPSENWRRVVVIAEQNLKLVWYAAGRAWEAYMPNNEMPELDDVEDVEDVEDDESGEDNELVH